MVFSINKNLNRLILPMRTWEPDAGVKVCKLPEAEKHPAQVPEQMPLSQDIFKNPFQTKCSSLLLPVCLSIRLDSLLLSVLFLIPLCLFPVTWLLALPVYNTQAESFSH